MRKNTLLLVLLTIILGCADEYEITPRAYPRLNTLPITESTKEGARFNAKIIYRGDMEILSYGFVWGNREDPVKEKHDKRVLIGNLQADSFSETIVSTLAFGVTYYVRAFVETSDFVVYGENRRFSSQGSTAPEFIGVRPESSILRDTIAILGKGFSHIKARNIVTFGELRAEVVTATDSIIKVIVPFELAKERVPIKVEVAGFSSQSNNNFRLLKPTIVGFAKNEFEYCDSLKINVANFPTVRTIFVNFLDKTTEARMVSENELITSVPQYLKDRGPITPSITIGNFRLVSDQAITFKNPEVTFLVDDFLSFHDTFRIQYTNLGKCDLDILCGGQTPIVINQGVNEIVLQVPTNITINRPPKVQVQVLLNEEVLIKKDFPRKAVNYSVTPSSGRLGEIVRLEGRGYFPSISANRIELITEESCTNTGCRIRCEIIEASARHILFKIPEGIENLINADGTVYLSVRSYGIDIPLLAYKIDI